MHFHYVRYQKAGQPSLSVYSLTTFKTISALHNQNFSEPERDLAVMNKIIPIHVEQLSFTKVCMVIKSGLHRTL